MPRLQNCVLSSCLVILTLLVGCERTGPQTVEELVETGKRHELAGEDRAAQISFKSALQIEPENKEVRLLLARSYLKTKQGLEAEKEFRQAEKLGVTRAALLTGLGDALLLAGKPQDVLREITLPETATPAFKAQVLRIRADAQYALMQFKDACQGYREAATLDNTHAPAHWGLANCAALDRDFPRAVNILDALVEKEPEVAEHRLRLGQALRLAGRNREAEAAFGQAIRLAPKEHMAYVNRAGVRLALRDEKGAAADIAEATKLSPKSPHVIHMQALMDHRRGDYTAARDKLQGILNVMYWNYNTISLYGDVLYRLGDYATAEKQLTRLLAVSPREPNLLRLIAAAQFRQGDARRALATLAPLLTPTQQDPSVLTLAAQAHLALGELTTARTHIERVLSTQPQAREPRLLLARVMLAQGQRDAAIAELERLAKEATAWGEADSQLIDLYLAQKQYDRVISYISQAPAGKRQDNPILEWQLGTAYAGKNDLGRARQHYQRALSLDPQHMPAALALAYLELKDKRPEGARKVFADILKRHPDHLQAMLGMAAVETAVGRVKESVQWLEKAAKAHPRALEPRMKLVGHHLRAGNRDSALTMAKELQTLAPNDPEVLVLLARAQAAQGEHASAVSNLRRALEARPGQPGLMFELANAQLAQGDTRAARASLEQLQRLDPESEPVRLALIRVDLAEGRRDAALAKAREMQKVRPNAAGGYILAGDILHAQGRYTEAVREYERAEAIRPTSELRVSMFKSLRGAGRAAEAEQRLAQWLRDHPQDFLVRLHLGVLYRETGRAAEALRQFDYMRRLQPDNALVLNELALTQQALGNRAAALEAAEKAYQRAPQPFIADTLAGVLLELGEIDRALDLWDKAIAGAPGAAEIRLNYARALLQAQRAPQARQQLVTVLRLPASEQDKAEARQLLAGRP